MRVLFGEHQRPACAQELYDLIVSLEHRLPGEAVDLTSKAPGVIDWSIHLGAFHLSAEHSGLAKLIVKRRKLLAILLANHEVIVAVTRRSVQTTRSRFFSSFLLRIGNVEFGFGVGFAAESHVFSGHQQR